MIRRWLNLPNDDSRKIAFVALSLCLVCSLLVSAAAVLLAPIQKAREQENLRRNVLLAAGLIDDADDTAVVNQRFGEVEARIVDLETGQFTDAVDVRTFDQLEVARDPLMSKALSSDEDPASIGRRERYARVFIVRDGDQIERLILPLRGYGLWSTMHAFIALKSDLNTVAAINFYEQGETPGLGAEVENPRWRASWEGRKVFDESGQPQLRVVKGTVNEYDRDSKYQVDGISGSTLTGIGVSNMISFWFGESGFGPFLDNLRAQGA
jgi:Na+-transporting NADH:ubiquinone oxidoreductase subunit C